MVDDHEEQPAETQAEEEHEREQVGMRELLRVPEQTNYAGDAADDEQTQREHAPPRVDHEPVTCRCSLRSHTKVLVRLRSGRWSVPQGHWSVPRELAAAWI